MSDTELELDIHGRCIKTGKFVAGYAKAGPGRPKGSRNKMTQQMLNRISRVCEEGLSPEDVMMSIYQNTEMPPELRFKAAAKVADLVYPKAASVEVKMDERENMTPQQLDDKIKQLMSLALNNQ